MHTLMSLSQLSVVGGWQKLAPKRSAPLISSLLVPTTFPFLHLHCPEHLAWSALMHSSMRVVLSSMNDGAQKSVSGIISAPVLMTHGAAQAGSWSRQDFHIATGIYLTSPPLAGTGWQNSSEKSGFFIGGNVFHLHVDGQVVSDLKLKQFIMLT